MSVKALSAKVDALIMSGMTGKDIARRVQCDSSTISRIRAGQISNPTYSLGIAIDLLYAERVLQSTSAA